VKNIKFKYRKKETKKVYTCRRLSQKAKKRKGKMGRNLSLWRLWSFINGGNAINEKSKIIYLRAYFLYE